MFSRVIVATDLSPASFAVVNCLGGLKPLGARECLLLQCISMQEAASSALAYAEPVLDERLTRQRDILTRQGFEVQTRVVPGLAKWEINSIATAEDYSLIVVGTQGHSLISEALLGGVAYGVIHNARKPVLVVPIELMEGEGDDCVRATRCHFTEHVLYPTDFSENAAIAFTYLEKVVTDGAKRVTLLHVQDKERLGTHLEERLDEFNTIDQERLEALKARLQEKGDAEIDIELPYGIPLAEINRVIAERNVHLVIMGSQGRGFVKEVFLGSLSHKVARSSSAPVLLVPARRDALATENP